MITINYPESHFYEIEPEVITEYNRLVINCWMDYPGVKLMANIEPFWVVPYNTEEGPQEEVTSAGTYDVEVLDTAHYDSNWTDESATAALEAELAA